MECERISGRTFSFRGPTTVRSRTIEREMGKEREREGERGERERERMRERER